VKNTLIKQLLASILLILLVPTTHSSDLDTVVKTEIKKNKNKKPSNDDNMMSCNPYPECVIWPGGTIKATSFFKSKKGNAKTSLKKSTDISNK
jgi:hypothetical protein